MKHTIIIILLFIYSIFIITFQYYYIRLQQKQILDLKEQFIYIQTCQEVMEVVKRFEEMDKEHKLWKEEISRDEFLMR